ncbi:glycosyltransferase family 2 protein [Candidatus Omnitrophota bacterium]
MPKISVILPAHNEEKAIGEIIRKIQSIIKDDYEIIVVDDGSTDSTADVAQKAGARIIKHPYNIGNGAAVKTGLRHASGKIFVLMDADGQHDPQYIPQLLKKIDEYDMVVTARTGWTDAPLHRRLANIAYNVFASYLSKTRIADLTSGFRVIRADVAKRFIYLLPNTFSYPSTMTMAVCKTGHSLTYITVRLKPRVGKSKINIFSDGVRFILIIMKIATLFSPMRIFFPTSVACSAVGIAHAAYKIFFLNEQYTDLSLMLITTGIMIFLMGLIAEQITQLRLERSEGG